MARTPAPLPLTRSAGSASPASRRLKRLDAGKNAGGSLFEMADYVACLSVIDSRNKPLRRTQKPFAPPFCCTLAEAGRGGEKMNSPLDTHHRPPENRLQLLEHHYTNCKNRLAARASFPGPPVVTGLAHLTRRRCRVYPPPQPLIPQPPALNGPELGWDRGKEDLQTVSRERTA